MMETKISMKPGDKAALGKREYDADEALEEACACDFSCLLELAADLQHVCSTCTGCKRQMLDNRGDGQQCEGAVQGRNQGNAADLLRGGEHGEEDAAECDGRDQIRDEYQLLNNLAVQLAAALRADITDDLAEDGAEYAVDEGELEGVNQRVDEVIVLEDTRLAFHDVRDRIADPVMQREVGQRVVALTEHEGLEDEQRDPA